MRTALGLFREDKVGRARERRHLACPAWMRKEHGVRSQDEPPFQTHF